MRDPHCYPGDATDVEIIQTHLSIVCLVGDRVYKFKKAITLPFVDFAPLASRRQACREEVRLNRRLCPDTYLGTVALRREHQTLRLGAMHDDDGPDDLDYAVVMRRLPQSRMLDVLVQAGTVTIDEIRQLAKRIAAFHKDADRNAEVLAYGAPKQLAGFADANFTELQDVPDPGVPRELLMQMQIVSARAFGNCLPELEARAAQGRVVDGHGDLHARNICMTDPVTIYDCIEFEPAFRCGDVATEVAFLAMDLRYRNATNLANTFVQTYVEASGDTRLPSLLPALCSYRAMVRGKVAALTAIETELPAQDRDAAHHSARQHLLLASAYLLECQSPWWLLVCGPPASGKSRLCAELHDTVQWPHLATDAVRKQLAGIAATAHARPEHYSPAFSERTYQELLHQATAASTAAATTSNTCVLLDGNFPTVAHRQRAAEAAAAAGARLAILYVEIDQTTAMQRAAARQHEAGNISDADPSITAALHAQFVAPTPDEADVLVRLPGTEATKHLITRALTDLLAQQARR